MENKTSVQDANEKIDDVIILIFGIVSVAVLSHFLLILERDQKKLVSGSDHKNIRLLS